jgi:hypothetical protein
MEYCWTEQMSVFPNESQSVVSSIMKISPWQISHETHLTIIFYVVSIVVLQWDAGTAEDCDVLKINTACKKMEHITIIVMEGDEHLKYL